VITLLRFPTVFVTLSPLGKFNTSLIKKLIPTKRLTTLPPHGIIEKGAQQKPDRQPGSKLGRDAQF
jgi:hypothetical protein